MIWCATTLFSGASFHLIDFTWMHAVNADALAVATAKAFSDPTLAPSWASAYAAAIAQNGCPAVQPALASMPPASVESLPSMPPVGRCSLSSSDISTYHRPAQFVLCAAAWAAHIGSPRNGSLGGFLLSNRSVMSSCVRRGCCPGAELGHGRGLLGSRGKQPYCARLPGQLQLSIRQGHSKRQQHRGQRQCCGRGERSQFLKPCAFMQELQHFTFSGLIKQVSVRVWLANVMKQGHQGLRQGWGKRSAALEAMQIES